MLLTCTETSCQGKTCVVDQDASSSGAPKREKAKRCRRLSSCETLSFPPPSEPFAAWRLYSPTWRMAPEASGRGRVRSSGCRPPQERHSLASSLVHSFISTLASPLHSFLLAGNMLNEGPLNTLRSPCCEGTPSAVQSHTFSLLSLILPRSG